MSEAERAELVLRRAAHVVARQARVPVEAVLNPRGWDGRRLRQAAIYLAVTAACVPKQHVAGASRLTRQAVQKTVAGIADRRDDPKVDARFARLERKMEMVA
jgi:hypothetical protein